MKAPNEQSKSTKANIVGVVAFGAFMRGAFDDQWFGDLLGYTIQAVGFLYWSHYKKVFWPARGVADWEEFRSDGFIRYMTRGWVQFGLCLGLGLGPALYIGHLIFDGVAHTALLFNHIKVSLIMGLALGIFLSVWSWLDCELIYRAIRSKPSTDAATEP